jgi:hypothetical protein
MENQTQFTIEMLKGNTISWTKEASIKMNGSEIKIVDFKGIASVWINSRTTCKRICIDVEINEAIIFANNYLRSL